MTPETQSGRRVTWPAIIALALIPLLAVAALIGLTNPKAENIQAAVVNLDEAVTVGDQYVPMGRQLAAEMIGYEGGNVTWTLADEKGAAEGLSSGKYSAVVTIPQEFSAAATSYSDNDAATATQATIKVEVSENAPVTDAQVAEQVARIATDTINSTLTEGYLDGIYVGFNTVGDQFTTIVDGAAQLADGSGQLADGVKQSSQGANQLADGMVLLAENGPKLADGGDQLVVGIRELASGVTKYADGAGQYSDGMTQYSDGVQKFADGVGEFAAKTPELVDGVGQLADGADQLLGGLPAFADGAAQAIGGVDQIVTGLDQVIAGLDQPQDFSQLTDLQTGARGVADGTAGISDGIGQVDQAMQAYSAGAIPPPAEVTAIADQIAASFVCPVADPATCAMLEQTFAAGASAGVTAGFQAGTGTASAALNTPDAATGLSLLGGASAVADGAGQLADGVDQLVTELPAQTEAQLAELSAGLTQIRDGADLLATEAQPIVDNAPLISSGAAELNDGIQQLNDQIGALPAGVDQLDSGAVQLADGAKRLAGGATELADGADQLDSGVGKLVTGAATYASGVTQYTEGVVSAADGAVLLGDGLAQLSDGMGGFDDGVNTFATELANGADQLPSYSQADRQRLSSVVASPVAPDDSLIESARVPGVSLLVVAALWLGALASFVVTRPVPRTVVSSRAPSLLLWAGTMWLPLVIVAGQGLILGVVGGITAGAGFGTTLILAGLLAALGASFVLANHALAAWFGHAGRAISVLMLIATIALGLSSATPGWLSPVAAVSPLQNGLLLVRAWLGGGSGEVGLAAVAVLMAAVGLLASVMAIATRRHVTAEQFRKSARATA